MEITTKYSCGDKVWVYLDYAQTLTIGQVRVKHTESAGVDGGYVEPNLAVQFDNYKPQSDREEEYMCVETGIGSGSVWRLDRLFDSKEECEVANAEHIAKQQAEKERAAQRRRDEMLAKEPYLRGKLEEIERIKAEV